MAEKHQDRQTVRLTFAIDGKPCYTELVEKGTRLSGLPKPS